MYDSVLGQGGGPAGWYSTNWGLWFSLWLFVFAPLVPALVHVNQLLYLRLTPKKRGPEIGTFDSCLPSKIVFCPGVKNGTKGGTKGGTLNMLFPG